LPFAQTLAANRLEQIVHRGKIEGADRVLVVGGDENDRRWLRSAHQLQRELQAVHARHANVDQGHVDAHGVDLLQRLDAVARFGHHFGGQLRRQIVKQVAQTRARRCFVVDQQQA
jgi:hypothetical protein